MPVSDGRIGRLRVTVTVILALIFAIVPLPTPLEPARPDLLLLLVIYWSLSAPRIAGLMFAWLCGLAIDLLKGTLLGQHAARLPAGRLPDAQVPAAHAHLPDLAPDADRVHAARAVRIPGVLDRRHHRPAGHDLDALDAGDHQRAAVAGAGRRAGHVEPEKPMSGAGSWRWQLARTRHAVRSFRQLPQPVARSPSRMSRSVRIKDHHAEQRLFERRAFAAAIIMAARARRGHRAAGLAAGRASTTTSSSCRRATASRSSRSRRIAG